MNLGLVFIDLQNDYFPNGRWELHGAEEAVFHAGRLLHYFRERGLPVIHVKHINSGKDAPFFAIDTKGAEIHHVVLPQGGEPVIEKHWPDSFYETDLKACLENGNIGRLVVCGMMTHMCVDTTVRAAKSLGYEITLIEDGCASRDLEWNGITIPADMVHGAYMAALNGRFARIVTADQWLKEAAGMD